MSAREPTPALRAVCDLGLRIDDLPAELRDRVEGLAAEVRASPDQEAAWTPIYSHSVTLVRDVLVHLETAVETLQREMLELDPNELRQRLSSSQRDEDKGPAEAQSALQEVERDWTDRIGRQSEHVLEGCLAHAKTALPITEAPSETGGLTLAIDETAWVQFAGYVARCCDEWTSNVTRDADQDAARAVDRVARGHGATGVRAPDAAEEVRCEGRLPTPPPVKNADVPTTMAALFQYIRSNIMTVGIFGTVIGVVVALAAKAGGGEGGVQGGGSMLFRGGLIIALFPIIVAAGIVVARRQRERIRVRALEDHHKAVASFLKTEVEKALGRHRKALERYLKHRMGDFRAAFDDLWQVEVLAKLGARSSDADAQIREAKLAHAKLGEQAQRLRSMKSRMSDNLLIDLRRRLAELGG